MIEQPGTHPQESATRYYINSEKKIALVRITPTVSQEWQSLGDDLESRTQEFDHRHKQTVWPSAERLDDYIKAFTPATLEDYLAIQFEHHQRDDFFREKANTVKQSLYANSQPETRNPKPITP